MAVSFKFDADLLTYADALRRAEEVLRRMSHHGPTINGTSSTPLPLAVTDEVLLIQIAPTASIDGMLSIDITFQPLKYHMRVTLTVLVRDQNDEAYRLLGQVFMDGDPISYGGVRDLIQALEIGVATLDGGDEDDD